MKIQINDQGREFANEVSKVLHDMIGTEQRITSGRIILIKWALWTTE